MYKLNIETIIKKIKAGEAFDAISKDGSLSINIEQYVPYICLALHSGGNIRKTLHDKIALNKFDRWYEEDPLTARLISSLPIRLTCNDSRYEYDLNRPVKECIYNIAWGKKVWKNKLSESERNESIQKHKNFYKVLHTLTEFIHNQFDGCIIYDIHSYNYKRKDMQNKEQPVFNLGTKKIDKIRYVKYSRFIKYWLKELGKIKIDSINVSVVENGIFCGKGYAIEYLMKHFSNILVLPTEIKKVYLDELSGDEYPDIISNLEQGLKQAIINHAAYFAKNQTNMTFFKKYQLLFSGLKDSLKFIDKELYNLLKKIEFLDYINPVNIETEKKRVLKSVNIKEPVFKYKPLPYKIETLKKQLYQLPVSNIKDVDLRLLYEESIDSYVNQAEMLSLRNRDEFLYSSLKYFGKPGEHDVKKAQFLLHCANQKKIKQVLKKEDTNRLIKNEILKYGFNCKVEFVKNLAASAMVVNSTRTLKLRNSAEFTNTQIGALVNHEVGIHLLTTMNAAVQPLKLLRLGLPKNEFTQEGLAILSEYLSGNLTIRRLKVLALRVIAVDMLVKGQSFSDIIDEFTDKYNVNKEEAFYITARVFRGGGFTKDYIYLNGFITMYKYYLDNRNFDNMLIGKCSLEYSAILEELIFRKTLKKPVYLPASYREPAKKEPIIEFILSSLI